MEALGAKLKAPRAKLEALGAKLEALGTKLEALGAMEGIQYSHKKTSTYFYCSSSNFRFLNNLNSFP